MSKINITYKTDVTKIGSVLASIDEKLQLVVDKAAFDIQGLAQQKIPVDTGAAKNSIYVKTSRENTQSAAVEKAKVARSTNISRWGNTLATLEFVYDGTDLKPLQAIVGVAVVYGMALEYGTVQNSSPLSSVNGQRPYLTPSVQEYRDTFINACRAVVNSSFR